MHSKAKEKPLWQKALLVLLAATLILGLSPAPLLANHAYAAQGEGDRLVAGSLVGAQGEEPTLESVKTAINALSDDPTTYTAADKERVEAIQDDYDALSPEDQAAVDSAAYTGGTSTQSCGRILESAVWAVHSYDVDNSTALADATYTTETTPAVSSFSDKGKSDSSRTRNWFVDSMTVADGKATADIYVVNERNVRQTSYSKIWMGGVEYPFDSDTKSFHGVPVDPNGTVYFAGFGSMATPIIYALTVEIEESISLEVTNNVSMFKPAASATLNTVGVPSSSKYAADLVLPMTTDSLSEAFVGTPSEAAEAAETVAFDTATATDAQAGTFTLQMKWIEGSGDTATAVNLANGEPFVISFKSASNGKWYGREAILDEGSKTLVFNPWSEGASGVDGLIAKIQSQVFTDTTWADCEAARAAWDALSDEDKALVKERDYFGRDTGDASKDDPLNQDGIGENEILVVSFGTSFNDSRAADIGGVEKEIQTANQEWSVRRAFTAQIIINHIYARDGVKIDNMKQALDRAVANGVKNLVVQPTHLMHGAEYDEMVEALAPYQSKMAISVAEPLLGEVGATATEVNADKLAVARAVVAEADVDNDTALVLMGHGTSHAAAVTYQQMQAAMDELGYDNVFVGTVEGEPESTACENVIAAVKAAGFTKVVLRPLMVVAGDHANNDMADPEDPESWYSQFTAEGAFATADVTCQIAGLGRVEDVQALYVSHTLAAMAPYEVTKLIEALPENVTTDEGKAAVQAARTAYNALTEAQQAIVDELPLLKAEQAIAEAEAAAAEQAAEDNPTLENQLAAAQAKLKVADAKLKVAEEEKAQAEKATEQIAKDACEAAGIVYDDKKTPAENAAAAADAQIAKVQAAKDEAVQLAKDACEAAGIAYDDKKTLAENVAAAAQAQQDKGAQAGAEQAAKDACEAAGIAYDDKKTPAENAAAAAQAQQDKGAQAAAEQAAKTACEAAGIAYDDKKTPAENAAAATKAQNDKIAKAEADAKAAEQKAADAEKAAAKTDLSTATVTVKSATYTGKELKPEVTVKLGAKTLTANTDYTVTYANNKKAGNGVAVVAGKGSYTGAVAKTFKIAKAKNTMTAKAKKVSLKASALKSKNVSVTKAKAFKIAKPKGAVTFKKTKGDKKIVVASNGKITVKKGLKAGTYTVKVKVTAKGNANFKKAKKPVNLKVTVK